MIVYIRNRDNADFVMPQGLSLRPLRYRSDAQGGPMWATLRIDGNALGLWRLLAWLRYHVEIQDDMGTPVWWGYINSVDLSTGGVGIGVSLDNVANSVAAVWSNDDAGGTTSWATDTTSEDEYGTKELLVSVSGALESVAEQRRDWELARRKYPSPTLSPGQNDTQYAIVECRGWFDTTAWKYYSRDEGLIEYVPSNGVTQKMGWGFASTGLGFTNRGQFVSEENARFNTLNKGEKFRVFTSASNNATFTVESSSDRESASVTDTTIAFLQQEKTATSEYIRASHDVARKLNNFNLKSGSVTVTNEGASTTYTITTDYTIDLTNGTITALSTGAITNNQVLKVSYTYTEYRIEDSTLGLAFVNANDVIEVSGSSSNDDFYRVISTSTEGDRVTVRESVTNEAPGATVTIARGSNVTVEESMTDELPGASATVYAYGWRIAQSFTVPSVDDWDVYSVEIKARRVGSPADNLRAIIYTNSAGSPGSAVETITITGTDVPTQMEWITFAFSGSNTLTAGTTYWLVVDRSGSASATAYFEVAIDEDAGDAGTLKINDGLDWQSRLEGGDLPFRILGKEETTTQIETAITENAEFITDVDLIDASGILTNQYRDGRRTLYDDVMSLLELGTTNNLRLLATVTRDRVLRIEEEPTQPTIPEYVLQSDGTVHTHLGQRIPLGHMSFVGEWMEIADLPPTADFSYINAPSPFLVESAQYDVEKQQYTITPRGVDLVWRAGMSIDEG